MGRRDALGFVTAACERAGENVVLVGGDDESLNGKTHALGIVASQHVAEIAGRNGKRDRAIGRAQSDGAKKIVDDLDQYARPVDRVDA